MTTQALFQGLVYDEYENLVETSFVGGSAQYVVDDAGFHRHIEAEMVDRQVLSFFLQQLSENKDMAVEQALNMMGKDDLFTKAALSSQIDNVKMDDIIAQGIPQQAREMMGMMGFRIRINVHGEIVGMDQPTAPDEF